MKCKYSFAVKSDVRLPTDITFKVGARRYELSNVNGRLGLLSVTVDDFPPSALPSFDPLDPGENNGISGQLKFLNDPLWPDLSADLRTMEGILSLWGIRQIDFESPTWEWIAESDKEKELILIPSFSRTLEDIEPRDAQLDFLVRSVLAADALTHLEIPLNFFRDGKRDLRDNRFVKAVHNFFFCLETQFGDGHFRTRQLVPAFRKSTQLVDAIEQMKNFPGEGIGSGRTFAETLRRRYLEPSADEIIQTLVQLRGELHHHTLKKRSHWNPGLQMEFELDALVLQWICHHAMEKPVLQIMFEPDQMARSRAQEVRTSDGRRVRWTDVGE